MTKAEKKLLQEISTFYMNEAQKTLADKMVGARSTLVTISREILEWPKALTTKCICTDYHHTAQHQMGCPAE